MMTEASCFFTDLEYVALAEHSTYGVVGLELIVRGCTHSCARVASQLYHMVNSGKINDGQLNFCDM